MPLIIRPAGLEDAAAVANAVDRLLIELSPREPKADQRSDTARKLIARPDDFVALLACDGHSVVGALTLSTCYAIYAGGAFGEIAELYVEPAWRSQAVGRMLVDTAVEHCRKRGWTKLEVGAPPAEAWARTVAFYKGYGFHEIGPRLGLDFPD